MKRLALLFVVAVVTPCCVLAWLALRALREEEAASDRQRVALAQGQTEAVAGSVNEVIAAQVHDLEQHVDRLLESQPPAVVASSFDDQIRQHWSFAQVGFALHAEDGKLVSPEQSSEPRIARFMTGNRGFLTNREPLLTYAFDMGAAAGRSKVQPSQDRMADAQAMVAAASDDRSRTVEERRKGITKAGEDFGAVGGLSEWSLPQQDRGIVNTETAPARRNADFSGPAGGGAEGGAAKDGPHAAARGGASPPVVAAEFEIKERAQRELKAQIGDMDMDVDSAAPAPKASESKTADGTLESLDKIRLAGSEGMKRGVEKDVADKLGLGTNADQEVESPAPEVAKAKFGTGRDRGRGDSKSSPPAPVDETSTVAPKSGPVAEELRDAKAPIAATAAPPPAAAPASPPSVQPPPPPMAPSAEPSGAPAVAANSTHRSAGPPPAAKPVTDDGVAGKRVQPTKSSEKPQGALNDEIAVDPKPVAGDAGRSAPGTKNKELAEKRSDSAKGADKVAALSAAPAGSTASGAGAGAGAAAGEAANKLAKSDEAPPVPARKEEAAAPSAMAASASASPDPVRAPAPAAPHSASPIPFSTPEVASKAEPSNSPAPREAEKLALAIEAKKEPPAAPKMAADQPLSQPKNQTARAAQPHEPKMSVEGPPPAELTKKAPEVLFSARTDSPAPPESASAAGFGRQAANSDPAPGVNFNDGLSSSYKPWGGEFYGAAPPPQNPPSSSTGALLGAEDFFESRLVSPEHLSASQQALAGSVSQVKARQLRFTELWSQERSGLISRFADDGSLVLIAWHRPLSAPEFIFGVQIAADSLIRPLAAALRREGADTGEFCFAILDQSNKPVARTLNGFTSDWRRPFVSTEIGSALPRWEIAAYLLDPLSVSVAGKSARWRLGLLVLTVLAAAFIGAWLIWREARRRLVEARQKTDFVSNVSHELRTPLTSIRMFSDLLAEPSSDPTPEKTRKYAEVISREAGRLTRLINNVLDFSRLERGQAPERLEPLDLRMLVAETLASYRPHIESQGFTLRSTAPSTPVTIQGDRDRVAQVLLNLLSNAEKYGGGETREIDVALEVDSGARGVVLTVSDRGPGIPRGREKRIFDKFYRAEDALASGVQGSGLGLTLARQIARAHGGDLACHRRDGGGSVFKLTLPASKAI